MRKGKKKKKREIKLSKLCIYKRFKVDDNDYVKANVLFIFLILFCFPYL